MAPAGERAWRSTETGVVVRVRVTPKSSRESVEGIESTADGPAFKVRVRAVPEDGAANAAVTALLADWLGVSKRSVTLASGARSRVKGLLVAGDAVALEAVLAAKLAELQRSMDD